MKSLKHILLITTLISGGLFLISPVMADDHGRHGQMGWKASLTESQTKQLASLKLNYKKKVYPLKLKLKQAKLELATLIATDKPSQKGIDKKIGEIIKLKTEKMRLKVAHKIAVRKILNNDQQVQFDLKLMKKAFHGKKGGHHGHH